VIAERIAAEELPIDRLDLLAGLLPLSGAMPLVNDVLPHSALAPTPAECEVRGLEAGVYDPRTWLFRFSLSDEGHQITR
jgi:hypothetical protein